MFTLSLKSIPLTSKLLYISQLAHAGATNPDSSIKAVQSYNRPIVLIAGGMDKQSSFDEFLDIAK